MGMLNAQLYKNHKPGSKVKYTTSTGSDSPTKQEFREESDMNFIIKRYHATGHLPGDTHYPIQPVFADVSAIPDYATSLRTIKAAEESFLALPADLRFRFGNKAENLVSFLGDDKNRSEAEELGLVAKKALPAPIPAPAPDPAVPQPKPITP